MSWAIGYDSNWDRDVGYGVPAICDHPHCDEEINRGISYLCGDDLYGGELGCGLFFCEEDTKLITDEYGDSCELCIRCREGNEPFEPKPDTEEWKKHKQTDPSWAKWREKEGHIL